MPHEDPFSFTIPDEPAKRKSIILRGYWLAQTILYEVYSMWSFKGIIILRSIILLLCLSLTFLTIRKQGASFPVAILLIAGVFLVSMEFCGERPQLFTFLTFTACMYLLEDHRIKRSKKVYCIPLLVMILSNMHPGYIVCILLISVYVLGEGVQVYRGKEKDVFKDLLWVFIITLVLSSINPNGPSMIMRFFSAGGEQTRGVVEFMTTFEVYWKKMFAINYSYIVFLLLSLPVLLYIRKTGITHLLLLIIFTAMSFIAIRFMLFYMFVAAVVLGRIVTLLLKEEYIKSFTRVLRLREQVFGLVVCIICIFLVFKDIPSLSRYEFGEDVRYAVPKGAVDFLSGLELQGNMFNEYGFGGYLIWRMYPQKKVFIDGRVLNMRIRDEYNAVASAYEYPGNSWTDIMDKYNVSFVVMPPLLPRGDIYPLVERLFDRDDWVLIYNDHLALIFLKKNAENDSVHKTYSRKKEEGLNTIIVQASARAMRNKTNPRYLITLGKVFYKLGRLDDAEKALALAYQRDTANKVIIEWVQRVKERRRATAH